MLKGTPLMLNPTLHFKGNAEDVLRHYRSALGGEVFILRFEGTPAAQCVPADWTDKVLYGALNSPHGTLAIMDAPPGRGNEPGGNISISVQAESDAQIQAIFAKLSDGGSICMPLEQTFFAEKFGMVTDRYGVQWMLSYGVRSASEPGELASCRAL
jgi:PhnB protein